MWVEKYRPESIEAMVGNEDARIVLVAWLRKWKKGGKAALLVGQPGTGKTTLVHLLAKEEGVNLVELNASDSRTKGNLEKKMGEAMSTVSLFGERSLIFLDEVDGLAGRADYGAVEFIKDAIKSTRNPIVMAANFMDADQVERLSGSSLLIRVKPPPPRLVEMYLKQIAAREQLQVPEERLRAIVAESSGDIRHAINSLQSYGDGSETYKDRSPSLSESMNAFFEAGDRESALAALRTLPLQPMEKARTMMRSVVRSNLPPDKLARSLRAISDADVLVGTMMRTQNWRTLRYLDGIFAGELSPAVRGERLAYTEQDLPWPVLQRLWNDSKKLKEMARSYSAMCRTSSRRAAVYDIPYVLFMCRDKTFRGEVMRVLGLEEPFEKFLEKEGKASGATE